MENRVEIGRIKAFERNRALGLTVDIVQYSGQKNTWEDFPLLEVEVCGSVVLSARIYNRRSSTE